MAEFVFLDAPHESLPRDDSNSSEGKAWYLPAISKDKNPVQLFLKMTRKVRVLGVLVAGICL